MDWCHICSPLGLKYALDPSFFRSKINPPWGVSDAFNVSKFTYLGQGQTRSLSAIGKNNPEAPEKRQGSKKTKEVRVCLFAPEKSHGLPLFFIFFWLYFMSKYIHPKMSFEVFFPTPVYSVFFTEPGSYSDVRCGRFRRKKTKNLGFSF